MDAAILFSDILTVPDAMGLGLYFEGGEVLVFVNPINNESDVKNLKLIKAEDDLSYVMNAVRAIRKELNGEVPLISFRVAPGRWQHTWLRVALPRILPRSKQWLIANQVIGRCWLFWPMQ